MKKYRNYSFRKERISLEERKEGFYYYEVRHEDNKPVPATVEKKVNVNFFGTVIMRNPIPELEHGIVDHIDARLFSGLRSKQGNISSYL